MKGDHIGELEELVLLAIGSFGELTYALTILHTIKEQTGRELDVTAIHSVLRRLEVKGMVNSEMGGSTAQRGGRRKRYFKLTVAGREVLDATMLSRMELYKKMLSLSVKGN
ncbi:MAG: DNA-binding PadR family transcriptional regulator [Cyclobacteriaceae bacterium]|jgi:PadR family transcriptional regulator PadR